MSKNMKIWIGVGAVAVILFFWLKGAYNGMVEKQVSAQKEWSNIDVILKRNQQDLNSLEKILKSVKNFNQETLIEMVKARARATQTVIDPSNCTPEQMQAWSNAQGDLERCMQRLMVVATREADYPELKGNEEFDKVMVRLEGAVNRLAEARRTYNDAVEKYMLEIRSFHKNIFAGMFGFTPMQMYVAPAGTEENTTDFSGLDD